ncbi:hypothetical protein ACHAWF_009938 [Thalassiosira exigua]
MSAPRPRTSGPPGAGDGADGGGGDDASAPSRGAGRPSAGKSQTKLKIRVKRWHGVAKWTWGVGDDEDDVCIVCQSAFEGVAPGVKFPGDECPVVWGKCGHAFHLQCVSAWLQSQNNNTPNNTPTCPTCRQEWEYGAEKPVNEDVGGNSEPV